MHKIFGTKEDKEYKDRIGAYIIPVKGNEVGVVETSKGYFLLGGGLDADETDFHCIKRYGLYWLVIPLPWVYVLL